MDEKDGIIKALESIKSYPKKKVGSDGSLELDFTLEQKLATDAQTNPTYYAIQVAKKAKDPSDNKKEILVFLEDQLMVHHVPSLELVRSQDLKSIGIKTDKTGLSPEEKVALRKRFLCYKHTALMVTDSTKTEEAVDNTDVLVEVDEVAEIEKPKSTNKEIIFPILIKPDNDPGNKWGTNYYWAAKQRANQATFNSDRSHKTRKHAARDLYTPPLTAVVPICDGVVIATGPFYAETDFIAVHHKTNDGREFLINYGEIDTATKRVKAGDPVKQGVPIGFTGKLIGIQAVPGHQIYMLHFEYYSGDLGYDFSKHHILNKELPYKRRNDLKDSLDILQEGYKNTFGLTDENIKEYTIEDARKALKIIFDKYGKDIAVIIEKMYRLETTHFESGQYKLCGSGGMEAAENKIAPYYGWDSAFFDKHPEHKFLGIKEIYENKGLSGQGGNVQVTNKPKRFIVLNSVLAGMEYKAFYINKYDGNYARWAGLTESVQETYRLNIVGVKARIVESF